MKRDPNTAKEKKRCLPTGRKLWMCPKEMLFNIPQGLFGHVQIACKGIPEVGLRAQRPGKTEYLTFNLRHGK